MSSNFRSRGLAAGLAALLAAAAGSARADTVDASSTTMLLIRDQARAGQDFTVAPLYEILAVSARNIDNPVAEDLQVVLSGWGALSLGKNLVWYNYWEPEHRAFGDLDLAFVQGDFGGRTLELRLGRQLVTGGVFGSIQLDGGHALLRLPAGFGLAGFVGSPSAQRFLAPGSWTTYNPARGNIAFGGRASWTLPGLVDLGASAVDLEDRGDPGRRQVGADLKVTPLAGLALLGNTSYDLYESRWAESNVVVQDQVLPALLVRVDYRHVEPDLLLSRSSILSVFAVDRRNEVGGGAQYDFGKVASLSADYHFLRTEATDLDRSADGHRISGRATWHPDAESTVGVELAKLRTYRNGYFQARGFGSRQFGPVLGTLDLQEYAFEDDVNAQKNSFTGTASVGYAFGGGWSALVSGTGGSTPYYDKRFDVMAKIAYNQTYHSLEVR